MPDEIRSSDIPVLPSKEFIKEYLARMHEEGQDLLEVVKQILDAEVKKAEKELEKDSFECARERIVSLITLNSIKSSIEIFEGLREYQKNKDTKALEKASEQIEVLLGLIRASSKAVPVRVTEILSECCETSSPSVTLN